MAWLTLALPLIMKAVQVVEVVMKGRKRGKDKKEVVVQMVLEALRGMAKAGDIPAVPSREEVEDAVESGHYVVNEGGGAGHIPAKYEVISITFAELLEIIKASRGTHE